MTCRACRNDRRKNLERDWREWEEVCRSLHTSAGNRALEAKRGENGEYLPIDYTLPRPSLASIARRLARGEDKALDWIVKRRRALRLKGWADRSYLFSD